MNWKSEVIDINKFIVKEETTKNIVAITYTKENAAKIELVPRMITALKALIDDLHDKYNIAEAETILARIDDTTHLERGKIR